jgi:hypothetical protein
MDVISKVEGIVRRIEPDLGAKYIGAEGFTEEGRPYIDAADFILELPDLRRARFCISGLDCIQRNDERLLEDLIRAKVKNAVRGAALTQPR